MTRFAVTTLAVAFALSACDPVAGPTPETQAYHKANRDAYLYQGR